MKSLNEMTLSELTALWEDGTFYGDFFTMLVELRTTNDTIEVEKLFEHLCTLLTQEAKDSFDRISKNKNSRLINEMREAGIRARGGL